MAMGQRGRREAENAIAGCRPFQNSTGHLRGTRGPARELGWLESHADHRRIRELLRRATYVVWSYETPIAFVSEDDEGNRTAYYVDETHTRTTSHHQGIACMGMGEYETIGSETRRQRERENRRRAAMRRMDVRNTDPQPTGAEAALSASNDVVRGYAEAARREPTAAHVYAARTPSDNYSFDGVRAARAARAALADSPGYQNGRTEDQQQATLHRLLDSRFSDPDWTPFDPLPEGAEARDLERVNREERTMDRGWTP